MVIKEAMRLEPTVAVIPRTLTAPAELGGYHLRAGSTVFLSPYLLHRDPRWWPRPERFDPTRFSAENEPGIPRYAYLPFGGGPRICLGNHFSLMEAQILLALIAGRYRLSLAPGARVVPLRQVTTSPLHGLPMRLHGRGR
jgi:cytochrome P450